MIRRGRSTPTAGAPRNGAPGAAAQKPCSGAGKAPERTSST